MKQTRTAFNHVPAAHALARCGVMLVLGLLASACGGSDDGEPAYAAPLRDAMLVQMQADRVPGALVYVNDPKRGAWRAALGNADFNGAPLDIASHMRVGSVTKTMVASAVLIAVDRQLVGLETPIETYLPGVPHGNVITVHHLLDHTAGLFNNTEDDGLNAELDRDPFQVFTLSQQLAIAFAHPSYFVPGPECVARDADPAREPCFHYSNTNYIVLGMLLEKVTGMAAEKVVHDWVFAPLGMNHTSIPPLPSAALPTPHPRGYLWGTNVQSNEAYKALIAGHPENSIIAVPAGTAAFDATDWNPGYTWTSGSAISTLADMAIWAKEVATGSLLTTQSQQLRLQLNPRSGYGLGVAHVLPGFFGHNGAIPGFQTNIGYAPDSGASFVVITNSEIAPNVPLQDALTAVNLTTIIQTQLFPAN
jgi:D-alanyl-D-alanine carboxypeptidase